MLFCCISNAHVLHFSHCTLLLFMSVLADLPRPLVSLKLSVSAHGNIFDVGKWL